MMDNNRRCKFIDDEPDVTEIIPNLFLGNSKIASSKTFLKNNRIGTIIRILENADGSRKLQLIKKKINSINYHIIPIKDVDTCLKNLNSLLDQTSEIIKNSLKNNVPVLVHCKRGHHRSGVIVAAFMIKYLWSDYISTIKFINHKRKCALRRDTCMVRGLFKYYMYTINKECQNLTSVKENNNNFYNYRCSK